MKFYCIYTCSQLILINFAGQDPLKIFKGASTIIMTLLGLGKLKFNIFTIPGVCMSILNIEYLREINVFEKELNEVLKKDD